MDKSSPELVSKCGNCPDQTCYPVALNKKPAVEDAPEYCPMRRFPEVLKKVEGEYEKPGLKEFARLASVQEGECYEFTADGIRTKFPRLEETIQFARKCNFRKIGLAFCIGLKRELLMVADILKAKGFEITSVNCKVGCVSKEAIGVKDEEKIMPGRMETMCNPIAQAELLNAEAVDLAIMMGLCVGHDSLFLKYVQVPCTVLAVKDRVMGHNPLAAVYLSKGPYYGRMRLRNEPTASDEKVRLED